MTPLEALLELLERAGAGDGAGTLVSEAELNEWPAEAVRRLKLQKLLMKAGPAASVVCPGCERQCAMEVHTVPGGTGKAALFVVCDKRDDINRVPISAGRLRQWRCGVEAVGAFVAHGLGMRPESQRKAGDGLWELGLATGKRRSQKVCLKANDELELVVGQNAVRLNELVRFGVDGYSVDTEAIRQLADATTTGDSRYTPSNARNEARKLETQALHESWCKAYRALKKRRPEMSDVWYARQIANLNVANGRSADTIRKHMKE